MRPIDADALINRMYHDAFETDTDMQKWDSGCWIRYKMFENAIDEQPTIEPKQGEWIVSDDKCFHTCQFCNADVDVSMGTGIFVNNDEVSHMNFCPNCGVKMIAKDINVPNKEGADDEHDK